MSLDINELSDRVLTDIKENCDNVGELSPWEAIDKFLTWNGIIGYTSSIVVAIDSIRAASTIHEIREMVSQVTDIDATFTDVVNCFDHHGHMGHPTLKMVGCALRLATSPTGRSLALLKIREVVG